jgi:ketosteroid isomerase-like protein
MIEETTGTLDFGAMREAIEGRDPDALLGFYSEDAELRIVTSTDPDGPAFELRGRAQIERYLRAVCDQEMTCGVEDEVVIGEGSVEFVEVCTYPNGTLISVGMTLEVREGRILRQLDVVEHA